MTEQPFAEQVAIVTGGGSGIGRSISLRLAGGGAAVAIVDWNLAGAEETVGMIGATGGRAIAIKADVSNSADVEAAVARTVAELGKPHILVNNAGITGGGYVQDIPEETWNKVLAVNLRGPYLFCKAVVPILVERGYGRIISIASGSGVRVGPGTGAYGASKAGVIALMKAVAGEVAPSGVTANTVAPGIVETPMTYASFGGPEQLKAQATAGRIANPMGVVLQPEDISWAVWYLAHPNTRYISGQTIHVNAGAFMP